MYIHVSIIIVVSLCHVRTCAMFLTERLSPAVLLLSIFPTFLHQWNTLRRKSLFPYPNQTTRRQCVHVHVNYSTCTCMYVLFERSHVHVHVHVCTLSLEWLDVIPYPRQPVLFRLSCQVYMYIHVTYT